MWSSFFTELPPHKLAFEVGFLLLALAQIYYALILKKLLTILDKGTLWILPIFAALLTVTAVAIHLLTHLVYLPSLDTILDIQLANNYIVFLYQLRLACFAALFGAGLLCAIPGFLYLRWISR